MTAELHKRTLSKKFESLDYDLIENVIYLEHRHKSRFRNFITLELQRWLAIFLIGFAAALSGFFAGSSVNFLCGIKFSNVIDYADREGCLRNTTQPPLTHFEKAQCMALPFLVWSSWNAIFTLFGSLMVTYIAPIAAGSGIPVVKCYLNGVKIPEVVRFKTYITKLLGVIASVTGGLVAGKEGPFIHCGAAIGAGLSQGHSTTFGFNTKLFKSFRNDRDKRDFVSAGAAAGVAAAFGAPIGGVLFALEEGASFWNQTLTWRIFFCSMMTSFVLNLFMSAYNNHAGILAFYSLVNFGLVEELDYMWFEIPIYICMAVCGGIMGAIFCYVHVVITSLRKRYVYSNMSKVCEAVAVAILTTFAATFLILYASECRPVPKFEITPDLNISENSSSNFTYHGLIKRRLVWSQPWDDRKPPIVTYNGDDEVKKALSGHIMKFVCPPGQYSEMSSLWLKTSEGVSSTFMVLQDGIWSMQTLSIFLVVYFALAMVTYGLSVSSGVFIPSLLIGATFGRLVGLILKYYLGDLVWLAQQNKFAIIGAVSVLGGIVRMTISLTVIVVEATGCISFGLPIMICLMVSKWVADSFIEGLYDLAIKMANVPFLEWEPPRHAYSIYASDIMESKVKVLRTTETVTNIISVLKTTTHNGFPVVDFEQDKNTSLNSIENNANSNLSSNDNYFTPATSHLTNNTNINSDTRRLFESMEHGDNEMFGSFQRCSITTKRELYGRFRGIVLRWQLVMMLEYKIFNENERSFENLNLTAFLKSYPRYPNIEQVVTNLEPESYRSHVDLRPIMNPTPYTVHYSASFPRIFQIFRSLGLRHLVVIDDRNQVVGMITRKDLARYVGDRDQDGSFKISELKYSS